MASLVSNMRRTAIGAVILVALVVEFAAQGGPADKAAAVVEAAVKKDAAEDQTTPSAAPRPAPTAWFAPTPDDESLPPAPTPPAPRDWGAAEAPHNPNEIRKPPPRGVDFPENG